MTFPFDDPSMRETDPRCSDRGQVSVFSLVRVERELEMERRDLEFSRCPLPWWLGTGAKP